MTMNTHYVKMIATRQGCDDDNRNLVLTYFKDQSYWMGPILYDIFKSNGWCEDAKESTIDEGKKAMSDKTVEKVEEKKLEEKGKKAAPENKAASPSQNK